SRRIGGDQLEALWQLLINATKTAIGKDRNDIPGTHLGPRSSDDRVDISNHASPAALLPNQSGDSVEIEALVLRNRIRLEDRGDYGFVGEREAVGKILLKHISPKGVGTRLENGPKAPTGIASAQCLKRCGDGRWMMRKVVDDSDAVDLRFDLEASFDALEGLEGG